MERENVWIDEVEGEAAKLENTYWLRSPQDQQMVESLSQIKKTLQQTDELAEPLEDEYFDRLHAKIMAKVEVTEVAPPPKLWRRGLQDKALLSRWFTKGMGMATLAALTAVSGMMMKTQNSLLAVAREQQQVQQQEQRLMEESLGAGRLVAQTRVTSQLDSDYFVDIAREGLDSLTQEQLDSLMTK